jgi:putative NIF3 family GTP cyclohydrolase 1 type 2
VKYDVFLEAAAMNINLVDAGHYATEHVVCPVIIDWLKHGFPDLELSLSDRHTGVVNCR